MVQTKVGAAQARANKIGIQLSDLLEREKAEKWCWSCRGWRERSRFNSDRSRYDGLSTRCQDCTRVKVRVCTKGRPSIFKGRRHTLEAKAAMSAVRKGRPNPARRGTTLSAEAKARLSAWAREHAVRGPQHYAWKDGAAARNLHERRQPEYKDWRKAVFTRDGFICQQCGDAQGGNLRAHHIKSYADHPELRLAVENGITLCHACHELEHYKPDSIRNLRKARRGQTLY
ncbi:HNH endonuclease [Methylobacterium sp. E-065]|uniref:HNH endonuclease n=1 Tax=Methylobacterium sp. E-065 TaxID=2836583 RepID=UPI001FB9FBF2|nr:HNH endonuclease [Methylobacterium sp. E-065]MCJ2020552.1 HNH endonuclease [Methylobacterium sp. E-065]